MMRQPRSQGALPPLAAHPFAAVTRQDLLQALANGWCLGAVVPMALEIVEHDPLASAGQFDGDLLRALMEVPGSFWGRHARLYERYRTALRAGAARRRQLPPDSRMEFWQPLATSRPPDEGPLTRDVMDDAEETR